MENFCPEAPPPRIQRRAQTSQRAAVRDKRGGGGGEAGKSVWMRVGLAQESQVATQPSSSARPTHTDRVIGSLARNSVRLEATDR